VKILVLVLYLLTEAFITAKRAYTKNSIGQNSKMVSVLLVAFCPDPTGVSESSAF